jgi:type II secretory ATPase GspE/PulE/Tfp pilus assembly ATPase PilB-like protein
MPEEIQHTDMAGAVARLSLRPAEIYREIKAGKLKTTTVEGRMVFAEADLKTFAEKRDTDRSELSGELARWNGELAPSTEDRPPEPTQPEADPTTLAPALAERLLSHAFRTGAIGVHLDPVGDGFRVLYRREGGLDERGRFSTRLGELVRQALKARLGKPDPVTQPIEALGKLDHEGQAIQILGTITPTLLGEHVHLRFRDPLKKDGLEDLGYTPEQADALRRLLDGRPGVLLVAGAADPFASRHRLGLADMLAAGNRLVVSLEHRIHYKSEILVQLALPTGESAEFAPLLAAALAMSPDVLFIDDVRTAEEAKGLFEAVAAGVTVVAQLRSPGNADALLRMVELGIAKDVLARDLLGTIARRSLRRICPSCAGQRSLSPEEAILLRTDPGTVVATPGTCAECGDGFRGRRILQDLWVNTPEMGTLVARIEPPAQELRAWGRKSGHAIGAAARTAVLAGEIALADVANLLAE